MFYYKDENAVYSSTNKLFLPEITEEEYNSIIESLQPTEEEIRAEKEEELAALMQELYPEFATQMLGALHGEETINDNQ